MATYSEEDELEYLIPSPVLTSGDKLFNFGVIAFSIMQMVEIFLVFGFVYLLWKILFFLPWQMLLVISILVIICGVIFITQPFNGLPGDVWIKYMVRYYVLERGRHLLFRHGQNLVRIISFKLLTADGRVALTLEGATEDHD